MFLVRRWAGAAGGQIPAEKCPRDGQKSALTPPSKCPILAASRIQLLIHVDGSASGISATTGFLRTAKRKAAGMDASGALRIH
jgi:hypothetical protein